MKKILLFVGIITLIAFAPSCKKRALKKNLVGEWTVTEMTLNGEAVELKEITNEDSLDLTSIRGMAFYRCEKQDKEKRCAGYMTGSITQYDLVKKTTVKNGLVYQFTYEIEKKDKMKMTMNYGIDTLLTYTSMLRSNLPKEVEINITDNSKKLLAFEIVNGEQTIKYTMEKKNQ